jgi:hypothetical protein
MDQAPENPITRLLKAAQHGDESAQEDLWSLIYYSGTDHLNTSCYYWLAA